MVNPKYVVWQSLIHVFVISLWLTNFSGVRSECSNDNEWECDDGQCIPDDKLCDGKVECRDRSDESAENCIHFHETCQDFAFRCAYGACIDGRAKCNDKQDCADNSDELICKKRDDSDFQGRCTDTEMQCIQSKECINSILLCDGVVNCEDGSDESVEVCINYGCISYGFQCGNGACINAKSKCNGVNECVDGSDEAWELCHTPRKRNRTISVLPPPKPTTERPPTTTPTLSTSSNNRCSIPNIVQLQNLQFKLHPQNQTVELGSYAEEFEIVHIACKNKYTLKGQPSLLCRNGEWDHDFPKCDGYCDGTILSKLSLRAICDTTNRFVPCPKQILPGSTVHVNCAFGYTRKTKTSQVLQCMPDGSFDNTPEKCEQNCGRIAPAATTLSKDGIEIDSSMAPWHVAIHENNSIIFNYKCGGSIVSPTVVISAAHCFWDEPNLIVKTYAEYQIIAGRSSSNYTNEQNAYSQIIKVQTINVPIEYQGKEGRQRDDIAFLKLEKPLRYSETIAPICLPNELRSTASRYVLSNKKGFINGFGAQNQLERLKMVTLAYHDCVDKSPQDAPVADDKFCIYNTEGGLVCRGDSGGGFFIESNDPETNEIVYRLWGVVSNTPTTKNDCTRTGDKAYVAITNIFNTASEFKRKLANARKEDEDLF